MGGSVLPKPLSAIFGAAKQSVSQTAQNVADATSTTETKVTKTQEEEGARMRASRRRGRQLLSDARLNPEGGVQTLGGGSNLG